MIRASRLARFTRVITGKGNWVGYLVVMFHVKHWVGRIVRDVVQGTG